MSSLSTARIPRFASFNVLRRERVTTVQKKYNGETSGYRFSGARFSLPIAAHTGSCAE